ncbi:MAG: bifunctional oligoribonuclease/PAP phosphatase NrnA [Candidatus Hatepunaea meridiana]|nr:bifunctional oligoribonuclease/PAP phosphatase NrnA [Candidatus Hatepunaea meridiana]
MNNIFEQIRDYILSDGDLIVVSHFSPDGDAIGSLLAFGEILKQLNNDYILAIDDTLPQKYNFLPGFNQIRNTQESPINRVFERVVILDAGSLPRIGSVKSCINKQTRILNIDHHFTGPSYGDINYIDVDASATAEILYGLCNFLDIEFTPRIIYGLYVGILTDTGRFRFSNTSARSMEICGDLISKGVDPSWVTENVYYNHPFEYLQTLAEVLLNMKLYFNGLACIISLDQNEKIKDTDGFVEYASSVKGVALAAFIYEREARYYKISLRSRSRIDVSEVAKKFGGGGHKKAAGFLYRGGKDDLIQNLLDEFEWQIKIRNIQPDNSLFEQPQEDI